ITPEPLVAGIPADLVALTKLRHCPLVRSAFDNETHPLVHRTALSPGHRPVLPADRELSPIFPVRSVTYLSGPNSAPPSPLRGEGDARLMWRAQRDPPPQPAPTRGAGARSIASPFAPRGRRAMIVDDPATKAEVEAVFADYERALIANDVAALDGFFMPSEDAI